LPTDTFFGQRREPHFGYHPALDGIRALAVAAVLLFHGGVAFLPGGFLGVDAFFVLSGFLITSLLLSERQARGRVRLLAFWGRRARRLLPVLLLVLIAVAVASRFALAGAADTGLLRGDALAALGYLANWRMIYRGGDYFAQTATASPLQHTWSLGIEEQFYLFWPLLVVGLAAALPWRRARATLLAATLLGAVGSAVAAAALFRPTAVDRAYFGTDTRAQALLIGCALGLLLTGRRSLVPAPRQPTLGPDRIGAPPRTRAAIPASRLGPRHPSPVQRLLAGLAVAGAALTGYLWTHASGGDRWLYRGGLTFGALAVAAVLAHAVTSPAGLLARVLAVPPLVRLGRVSYGVYLWHWPLFQLLTAERTGERGLSLLALRCTVTVLVASASYHLIERPIRRAAPLRWRVSPRVAPAVAAGATAAAMGAVAVVVLTTIPATPMVSAGASMVPLPTGAAHAPSPAAGKQRRAPVDRPGRRPGAQPRVSILGDSVAWSLGTYLPATPGLAVTVRAVQGCGIALLPDVLQLGTPHTNYPGCERWPDRWAAGVARDDPDVAVILLNRWELMDRRLNGAYRHVGQPDYDAYLGGQLDRAVSVAGRRGARVVLLTAAYTHRAETPSGGLYPEDQPARVDAWNRLLRRTAARHPDRISVLDLNAHACPAGRFAWQVAGVPMRSDGLHFTPAGVRRVIAPWLLPELATAATTGGP
jgi:peptidoglycan/LPS O-acetylase OafA/YrhL